MDFGKALRVMRHGGRVKRDAWSDYTHGRDYMVIRDGRLVEVMIGGFVPSYIAMGSDDLLAEDWVEVR